MMRTVLVSALAAVALAFPVVHQVNLSGPEVPANRSCTPSGTKCAGAANRPFVPYAPCCESGLVCGVPAVAVSGAWGSYCLPPPAVSSVTPPPAGTTTNTTTTTTSSSTNGTATAGAAGTSTTAPSSSGNTTSGSTGGAMATMTPTGTTTNTTTSSGDKKCFPSSATVELEDGSVVSMEKLSVGDFVKVGPSTFSKVFMFTHKMQSGENEFVQLTTSSGASIALTKGHYIPVDGALVSAGKVVVGSQVELGNGEVDTVVSVGTVVGTGLYNPQTLNGNVVVNGIVASTYTTAVEPRLAHAILSPFRSLSTMFGFDLTLLESGGGALAQVAPRGAAAI